MQTTVPEFTEEEALRAETLAEEAIGARAEEVRARVEAEVQEALEAVREYADHLAGGGDPLAYPDVPYGALRSRLVSPFVGLLVVYQKWNEARGGRHDVEPFRNHQDWRTAEALVEQLGTPILYAELSRNARGGSTRATSDDVAKAAFALEGRGELVVRRTKVDGKVAFLARDRRPDDPPQNSYSYSGIPTEGR